MINPELNGFTEVIASEVVHPDDIDVKFSGERSKPDDEVCHELMLRKISVVWTLS